MTQQPDRPDDARRTRSQMMGIGSGQLSGVRPGAGQATGSEAQKAACEAARQRVNSRRGLAARYFNRTIVDRVTPLSSKLLQPAESLLSHKLPDKKNPLFSI